MSKLLSALIAIAFSFVTASSFAVDTVAPAEPAAMPAKADKPMKKHVKKHVKKHKVTHRKAMKVAPATPDTPVSK